MADQTTAPQPPKGRPADDRLVRAITDLNDQFAVCGLQQPVAIVVAPEQAKWIQAMLANSSNLLFEDKRCRELRVWGVQIREDDQTTEGVWQPMSTAPKNATWVKVKMADGTEYRAHWASDLSGEEQPPFRGWFVANAGGRGFHQIDEPVGWRAETVADLADRACRLIVRLHNEGVLSEGQCCNALGMDRLAWRVMCDKMTESAEL